MSIYNHLLHVKHSDCIEVELHLTEKCNLSCAFCCQNHNDTAPNKDRLEKKLHILSSFFKKQELNSYQINLMGGELLLDTYDDSIFELYKWFIHNINSMLEGKKVSFWITTNLIFNKKQRVSDFFSYLDSKYNFKVSTSYDVKLRNWSEKQFKESFQTNLEYFEKYIENISIVLHKPTITHLISYGDPYLSALYKKFNLTFDWYVPKSQATKRLNEKLCPSDSDCKEILFYLQDNYPESSPVKEYTKNENNSLSCCSENRILIDAFNEISNCIYLANKYNQSEFKTTFNKYSIEPMFKSFINSKKCLSCEHFNKCGLVCFALADYKFRAQDESCFMKDFFNELKNRQPVE